jgi:hypothetical protein
MPNFGGIGVRIRLFGLARYIRIGKFFHSFLSSDIDRYVSPKQFDTLRTMVT